MEIFSVVKGRERPGFAGHAAEVEAGLLDFEARSKSR